MGYELYRHALDHAPAEIDATARLVLAVIADDANDRTRVSYIPNEVLSHRCGATPEAIRKALGRLAKAGYELRVALGTDVNGQSVFAARHRRATYYVPAFPERSDLPQKPGTRSHLSGEEPHESREHLPTFTEKAGNTVPPSAEKVGTGSQKVGTGSHPSPQSPHTAEASPIQEGNNDHNTTPPSPTTKNPPTTADDPNTRTDIERVCTHLRQRVIDNGKPAHRVTITADWRTAARLLMDRDGVTEEQIHRAIDWVQDHNFWRVNIRSMPKLRTKYFELRDEAHRHRERHEHPGPTMSAQRTAERCSEHHMVLPCGGCIGEINAGDSEVPLRLLAEHGPRTRPDLAQRLNGHGATA